MIADKHDNTITKQLHTAANLTMRSLEQRLKPLGVNGSQFFFILKLHDDPGITQDQLVRIDSLHQSNVNREIAQLAKLGLVNKRKSATDGRKYELRLTAAGETLYPQVKSALDAQEAMLHQALARQVAAADFLAALRAITQATQ